MAFNCSKNAWTLRIKPTGSRRSRSDGKLRVNEEDGSGNFTGTHTTDDEVNTQVTGNCRDDSGLTGHIKFDRTVKVAGQTFVRRYEGDFKPNLLGTKLQAEGTYRRIGRSLKVTLPEGEDDGTWIGEKPVT